MSLSFRGDVRQLFGAENPKKLESLVAGQGGILREIYSKKNLGNRGGATYNFDVWSETRQKEMLRKKMLLNTAPMEKGSSRGWMEKGGVTTGTIDCKQSNSLRPEHLS